VRHGVLCRAVQVGDARDYVPIDVNARTGSWGKPSDMPGNRCVSKAEVLLH
jgi:hypothetical protein